MKRVLWGVSALVLAIPLITRSGETGEWKNFGAAFTVEKASPAKDVLADPASFAGKTVRIEGHVADVCQNKGCWLVVTEGQNSVRVTMKDYGFFVPTDSTGATADLEGTIVEKPVDPAVEAHMESEATHPELQPKPDSGKTYELVATAIRIKKT